MKVKQKFEIEKELFKRIKALGHDPKKFVKGFYEGMTMEDVEKIIESIKEEKKNGK